MIFIFYLAATLDAIAFSMFLTIMTPYVFSLGGTQFYMGLVGSTCAFISLIWNPIVGSLSDRLGRKKVLLYCLAICFVANFIVYCFSSLTIYFISRILAALGIQIMTLIKSLIDDNIPAQDEKMSAIGKIQAVSAMSFIIGPIISGHLSEYESGLRYAFLIISAMFAVNFGLIFLVKDNTQTIQQKKQSFSIFKEITLAAKNLTNINWPKYWDLFTMKLILDFVLSVFHFNTSIILSKQFQVTGKSYGYIIASMSVIGITMGLTWGKLKKYFYSKDNQGLTRLLHGYIMLLTAFGGSSMSSSLSYYIISCIPLSIARVLIETTLTEILLLRASPTEKGSIMGTFDSTMALSGLIAPMTSGIIADTWGEQTCLLSCMFPVLLGVTLTYSQKIKLH